MTAATGPGKRIGGLEGLRGLTALYVVLHHCRLLCFPGYPADTGPAWLGWLLYGRLAVVAFIVLSGFSLALAPARDGWRIRGGLVTYLRRRARRILPPYWIALAVSLVIAWLAAPLPLSHPPTLRAIVVYALLLQDLVAAPAPNGAFWSIAVEAVLYLAFPVLVLVRRYAGAVAALLLAVVPAVVFRAAPAYSLQLAPLFALGVLAAGVSRHRPWPLLSAAAAVPVVVAIGVGGSIWTVRHYFWIDLASGPAIAALLAGIAGGRPVALVRVLTSRALTRLGRCSYSLYLLHMPVVALINRRLVAPHVAAGLPAFGLTVLLAVPASIGAATLFAALVENRVR